MVSLFEPLQIRGVQFRNRIGVAPMCQFSSADGRATDWHLVHLGSRAVGGAGLVLTEATAVSKAGRISPCDLGLWCDDQIAPLARIARFVQGQGAAFGLQLAHSGRKGSRTPPWGAAGAGRERALRVEEGGWPVAGPSALPSEPNGSTPDALEMTDIRSILSDFQYAARRAIEADVDVLEVHAAHGYLVSSFNSPLSNHRTDAYGGEFDGRVRFARELARTLRQVWPEARPLFFRLSATDWIEAGWTIAETVALARLLREDGVDLIDCSSGGVAHAPIPVGPGYQVPLARAVRREAGVATAAVGLITTPSQANEIIAAGDADLVLLGRESLRDPYWPHRAAIELGAAAGLRSPIQYATAWRKAGFSHAPLDVPLLAARD